MSTPAGPENGTKLPSLREKGTTIKELLVSNSEQIKMALPRFLPLDRLIRTALTVIATTPGLLDCHPRSLLGAVIQCAQLGLEPGVLGQAYLIPFKNTRTGRTDVQFIPGYRGLLALARRTGDISTVQAHVVRGKDQFDYRYGTDPMLEHKPAADPGDSAITHIYAVIKLKDGAVQFDVMTKSEMDAHRDRYSRAAKAGPWVTAWEEMAKKTVLRRLLKLAPASIEMQTALVLDEKAEYQLPQGLDALPEGLPDEEGDAGEGEHARPTRGADGGGDRGVNALVLDTETTGLVEPRPVEIAWLRLSGPTDLEVMEDSLERFDPDKAIEYGAMATHHITAADVQGKALWTTFRLPPGIEYLIGHNVDFDWRVIGEPPVKRICTLALARALWPTLDSHTLGALVYFIAPRKAKDYLRAAHTAAQDVWNTQRILWAILERLGGAASWEALWKGSEAARVPTVMDFGKHRGTAIQALPIDYRRWMLTQVDMDPYLIQAVRASLRA